MFNSVLEPLDSWLLFDGILGLPCSWIG